MGELARLVAHATALTVGNSHSAGTARTRFRTSGARTSACASPAVVAAGARGS